MEGRKLNYFVADVHLGLDDGASAEREARFLAFLKSIPEQRTRALYLLGDIWDFWYEYRDVVPREAAKVVAQLVHLMNCGVSVYFFAGNHDIWTYSFFESLGMKRLEQPAQVNIDGMDFCLGHGDSLGGGGWSYTLMLRIFRCRFLQRLFSTIHPWIAYRLASAWSGCNRKKHKDYVFDPDKIPLRRYVEEYAASHKVDCFIFGHYHHRLDTTLASGERFMITGDWLCGESPYVLFDGQSVISSF